MNIPLIRFDEREAADAYLAHIALIECELRDPTLKNNSAWKLLRHDAVERFATAYERV